MYVGNLSFYTTEEQIHELFSKAGEVKRIIMGLDRFKKTPCGFCFVESVCHLDTFLCVPIWWCSTCNNGLIRKTNFFFAKQ